MESCDIILKEIHSDYILKFILRMEIAKEYI